MKELLKNPEQNKELLALHKVDTAKYGQATEQQQTSQEGEAQPVPAEETEQQADETTQQAEQPPAEEQANDKATSPSTTAASTGRRLPNAGASTSRHWNSRVIWSVSVIKASRSLWSATPISAACACRCRRGCRCVRTPTARCRLFRTRSAASRTSTNTGT